MFLSGSGFHSPLINLSWPVYDRMAVQSATKTTHGEERMWRLCSSVELHMEIAFPLCFKRNGSLTPGFPWLQVAIELSLKCKDCRSLQYWLYISLQGWWCINARCFLEASLLLGDPKKASSPTTSTAAGPRSPPPWPVLTKTISNLFSGHFHATTLWGS